MNQEDTKAELEKLCDQYKASKFPDCPEVRPRDLWEKMTPGARDVLVVDVRRREEQEVRRGEIPREAALQPLPGQSDRALWHCLASSASMAGITSHFKQQNGPISTEAA